MNRDTIRSRAIGIGLGFLIVMHANWLLDALPIGDDGTADWWPVISSIVLVIVVVLSIQEGKRHRDSARPGAER